MSKPSLASAVWFGLLAAISAALGTFLRNIGIEASEPPGLAMVLTGIWFGLAVAGGLAICGYRSIKTAVVTIVLTLVGWQAAFNLAFFVAYYVNDDGARSYSSGELAGGFLAGAVGAAFTWAGVAYAASGLRTIRIALTIALTGAVLGLLLRIALYDERSLILLLLPWQVAVAGALGYFLARTGANRSSGGNPL